MELLGKSWQNLVTREFQNKRIWNFLAQRMRKFLIYLFIAFKNIVEYFKPSKIARNQLTGSKAMQSPGRDAFPPEMGGALQPLSSSHRVNKALEIPL